MEIKWPPDFVGGSVQFVSLRRKRVISSSSPSFLSFAIANYQSNCHIAVSSHLQRSWCTWPLKEWSVVLQPINRLFCIICLHFIDQLFFSFFSFFLQNMRRRGKSNWRRRRESKVSWRSAHLWIAHLFPAVNHRSDNPQHDPRRRDRGTRRRRRRSNSIDWLINYIISINFEQRNWRRSQRSIGSGSQCKLVGGVMIEKTFLHFFFHFFG